MSVVSHKSIWIAFLIAGLNDLKLFAGKVTNACLNAPCRERISWFEGQQVETTGDNQGELLQIIRALHGLKL